MQPIDPSPQEPSLIPSKKVAQESPQEPTPNWPDALTAPTAADVAATLAAFWEILAHVPDCYQRGETIILHALLGQLRHQVTCMMLAANGIRYPHDTRHLNLYLGESQRAALEKTLRHPSPTASDGASSPADSLDTDVTDAEITGARITGAERLTDVAVAQALSLVVIYRWYAPQLAEKFGMREPHEQEATVLAAMHAAIPFWPRTITTH